MPGTRTRARKPRFFNRELSWVEFNRRVLAMAQRQGLPLLERLRYLAIVASNFDEFFLVRVASLRRQVLAGDHVSCPSGMSPSRQLNELRRQVKSLVEAQYRCFSKELLPALAEQGIQVRLGAALTPAQRQFMADYFQETVFPLLTPVRLNLLERNPNFRNLRLHVAFLLEANGAKQLMVPEESGEVVAVIQVPSSLKRQVWLPEAEDELGLCLLEELILQNAESLFPGYRIKETTVFRISRDADMGVDENRDDDFVEAMEQILTYRESGMAVRLEITKSSKRLRGILMAYLELEESGVYDFDQALDLSVFFELANAPGFDHLRYEPWPPLVSVDFPLESSIFDVVGKRDVLLAPPYESFDPVIRLLQEAAVDSGVLAIKMTLYRTSGDSPIVEALAQAARNGKHVTVLVEIKARFDEARNIAWAERLAQCGVIVIYGLVQLKVHAKAMLIIRREASGMRRYVHLSTGNYNDRTARIYSDVSLFTSNEEMGYEACIFFNAITGYSAIPVLKHLAMAPSGLKARLLQLIERESLRSTPEMPGLIEAKLNSLADSEVINALYRASQAGVQIRLNIRGICMLVPGVPELSHNIRVSAIVDRYLEHSRVFHFQNGGQDEYWCASADWMPRNLEGRVELMFPIHDKGIQQRLQAMLDAWLNDNRQAFELRSDGSYVPVLSVDDHLPMEAQATIYRQLLEHNRQDQAVDRREFRVRRKPGT